MYERNERKAPTDSTLCGCNLNCSTLIGAGGEARKRYGPSKSIPDSFGWWPARPDDHQWSWSRAQRWQRRPNWKPTAAACSPARAPNWAGSRTSCCESMHPRTAKQHIYQFNQNQILIYIDMHALGSSTTWPYKELNLFWQRVSKNYLTSISFLTYMYQKRLKTLSASFFFFKSFERPFKLDHKWFGLAK